MSSLTKTMFKSLALTFSGLLFLCSCFLQLSGLQGKALSEITPLCSQTRKTFFPTLLLKVIEKDLVVSLIPLQVVIYITVLLFMIKCLHLGIWITFLGPYGSIFRREINWAGRGWGGNQGKWMVVSSAVGQMRMADSARFLCNNKFFLLLLLSFFRTAVLKF